MIIQEKERLRQQMRLKREALPAGERLSAAQAIANHFADHPYLTYAASFAGYYAMRGELDVLPIFNRMRSFNKRTALPFIAESGLLFKEWQPGVPLQAGPHGTREPEPHQPDIIPQVILTPLLAFDKRGFRLGYGGGYYDRAMASLRQEPKPPLFMGVAFAVQEIAELPVDAHDGSLDGILTPQGVSMFA